MCKINVVNLEVICDYLKEQGNYECEIIPNIRIGICTNESGTYVLDSEGNGFPRFSKEQEMNIEFFNIKDGDIVSCSVTKMKLGDIIQLPVLEEVSLDEFIVDTKINRDLRFRMWQKVIGEELLSREELKKYGKYLVNRKCDCEEFKSILADRNSCQCKEDKAHEHCLNCGGIIKVLNMD